MFFLSYYCTAYTPDLRENILDMINIQALKKHISFEKYAVKNLRNGLELTGNLNYFFWRKVKCNCFMFEMAFMRTIAKWFIFR